MARAGEQGPEAATATGLEPVPPFERRAALFLDVDGTLLDIAARPQDVSLRPGLVRILGGLRQVMPVVLISGRRIADLDRLFAPLVLPAAGQHGAERRAIGGETSRLDLPRAALEQARDRLQHWAQAHPGVLVEDKGATLALHYRRAPQLAAEATQAACEAVERLGPRFTLVPGAMVCEIRPSGCDKGRAIAEFLAEPACAGRRPCFIGDDTTDEDGFALVNRLGGCSIKVGPGPSVARWRFPGVDEVLAWLERYARWLQQDTHCE